MTKKNNKLIGIIGYGEVGQAIAKFYPKSVLRIKDLKRDDGLEGVEILNICLPWMKNFIPIVKREIMKIKPKLTIIHSTVPVDTTKKITLSLPKGFGETVVHSPIRGIHPELYKGIKTFIKYIGADNKKAGKTAERHLRSLGMKTKLFMPSTVTELGKLLDTTYYGLCIAWHGEMGKMCDKFKVNFEEAVTNFNKSYNEGYKKLGKTEVMRPVLYPPKRKIGSHCILPNTRILNKHFKSKALDLILKYSGKSKN